MLLLVVLLVVLVMPVLDVGLQVPAGEVGPPAPSVAVPSHNNSQPTTHTFYRT